MINGLEGIPGSGKSYEACVYHVLEALKIGRKVITNLPLVLEQFRAIDPRYAALIELRVKPAPIRGTWDATRMDEQGNGNAYELFDDGRVEAPDAEAILFGTVWCYWSDWRHPGPAKEHIGLGPLYVIDECHVALPSTGTEKTVVEWYKLHRHFGAPDVLLMTQSFRDINQPIARLIGMLVKVRKADIMGKADHYIRKVHSGYRGAVISTEQRKYLPQMFPLYKSHTQGSAVLEAGAQDVAPFLVKWKRFSRALYVVIAVLTVWAWWPSDKPAKPAKPARAPAPERIADATPSISHAIHTPAPAASRPAPADSPADASDSALTGGPYPEPYARHQLHVTGWITFGGRQSHTFSVLRDGAVLASITTSDLERAGYEVKALSECAVVVTFGTKQRTLVCDAPRPTFDGHRTSAAL